MKAKVLFFLIFFLLTMSGFSKVNIENNPDAVLLTLDKVNKDKQTNNNPKSPDLSVWILGHTLYFYDVDESYTLT